MPRAPSLKCQDPVFSSGHPQKQEVLIFLLLFADILWAFSLAPAGSPNLRHWIRVPSQSVGGALSSQCSRRPHGGRAPSCEPAPPSAPSHQPQGVPCTPHPHSLQIRGSHGPLLRFNNLPEWLTGVRRTLSSLTFMVYYNGYDSGAAIWEPRGVTGWVHPSSRHLLRAQPGSPRVSLSGSLHRVCSQASSCPLPGGGPVGLQVPPWGPCLFLGTSPLRRLSRDPTSHTP